MCHSLPNDKYHFDSSKFKACANYILALYNKILDWTKFKAFADDKLNVARLRISMGGVIQIIVGKKRRCW